MTSPRQTIIFTKVPLDQEQMKRLGEVFNHPGFSLLKEIIGAHTAKEQVGAMNSGLYADISDNAKRDTSEAIRMAAGYSMVLDVLEEISSKQEEWFTAKLEARP